MKVSHPVGIHSLSRCVTCDASVQWEVRMSDKHDLHWSTFLVPEITPPPFLFQGRRQEFERGWGSV